MATPWWVDRPGTLQQEFEALERAGIPYRLRDDLKAQGILEIDASVVVNGEKIEVEVVYPDFYPYVRFEVYAPNLDLPRHQNPFQKNLCLIARATENWDVEDTAGEFLAKRLPLVIVAGRAPSGSSPVPEVPQGEPLSNYYPSFPGASILIDSAWAVPKGTDRGWLKIFLDERPVDVKRAEEIEAPIVRGVVAEIQDLEHHTLIKADAAMLAVISNPSVVSARWLRLDPPPSLGTSPRDFEKFNQQVDTAWGAAGAANRYGRYSLEIAAVLFEEEVSTATYGDAWLFRIRTVGRGRNRQSASYLARAGRAGRSDFDARVPELHGLRDKKVLFVGVGGVGSVAVLELARAGIGELRLLDPDVIDPGTVVRYPLGLGSAGMPKVLALADWVAHNLPYTTVKPYWEHFGHSRRTREERSESELWDELADGADLVVDATAERGLHYLISDLARARGIAYVEAATRNGAWGGVLARIGGGLNDACWLCYQHLLDELSDASPPAAPSADPAGEKQPLGCADPTFSGAGFDVAEYGLSLARLVAGTLLEGVAGGYPSPPWDIAISNLRSATGELTAPTWQTWSLEIHTKCPKHRS